MIVAITASGHDGSVSDSWHSRVGGGKESTTEVSRYHSFVPTIVGIFSSREKYGLGGKLAIIEVHTKNGHLILSGRNFHRRPQLI